MKPRDISAFDAKTHLSELLRETERGYSFTIRRRGKAVARLVPVESGPETDIKEIAKGLREIRRRGKGRVSIRQLIDEGRRF